MRKPQPDQPLVKRIKVRDITRSGFSEFVHYVAVVAAVQLGVIILIMLISSSNFRNQNPTGCAYGDSIPVDSPKCSPETFRDKGVNITPTAMPTTLPSVGGSGK
jgi:hypothetical protein